MSCMELLYVRVLCKKTRTNKKITQEDTNREHSGVTQCGMPAGVAFDQ